jgi:hypothetical protein
MLNSAGLKDHLRSGVWAECAMTVTYLSKITSIKEKLICPYQLLFGNKPRIPESLRSFDENGVVTTKNDIQWKLTNRGTRCMFMGYSINHAHDVYRMSNIETKKDDQLTGHHLDEHVLQGLERPGRQEEE